MKKEEGSRERQMKLCQQLRCLNISEKKTHLRLRFVAAYFLVQQTTRM